MWRICFLDIITAIMVLLFCYYYCCVVVYCNLDAITVTPLYSTIQYGTLLTPVWLLWAVALKAANCGTWHRNNNKNNNNNTNNTNNNNNNNNTITITTPLTSTSDGWQVVEHGWHHYKNDNNDNNTNNSSIITAPLTSMSGASPSCRLLNMAA